MNYKQGFNGKKIMVLGDSHYCAGRSSVCETCGFDDYGICTENKNGDFTTNVVKRYLAYHNGEKKHERWMNTYTAFAGWLYGEFDDPHETPLDVWNAVAFYNFVQIAMPEDQRKPTEDDFAFSAPAFYEVLRELKPDLVIVWGKRLWEKMPDDRTDGGPVLAGYDGNYYDYHVDGKLIRACHVSHPCQPAPAYKYYYYLQAALKMV